MDETGHETEAHIDRTRERLGSHLRELEERVEAATDWREQFRQRPGLFLGAAVAGGAILASVLRARPERDGGSRRRAFDGTSAQAQAFVNTGTPSKVRWSVSRAPASRITSVS